MTADNPAGNDANGSHGVVPNRGMSAQASRTSQLQEWKITFDNGTGLVTRLEKLSSDGTDAAVSYEGVAAVAIVYGIPPEVAEAALSGTMSTHGNTIGLDPAALAAWQNYGSIPHMFSYWQGYADAVAARAPRSS